MKIKILLLTAVLLVVGGCTSFQGIKPVSPEVGNPNFPTVTDSLQPTFRWEASPEPDTTYDFIVYEGIKVESFVEGIKRSVGKEVYYRQGLKTSEHKIEELLQPDAEYYWTVRMRHGDNVSEWAKYDYTLFLGTAYMKAGNRPFIFKTPRN
jgi:uncharacterized protein (DUF2164 family)